MMLQPDSRMKARMLRQARLQDWSIDNGAGQSGDGLLRGLRCLVETDAVCRSTRWTDV